MSPSRCDFRISHVPVKVTPNHTNLHAPTQFYVITIILFETTTHQDDLFPYICYTGTILWKQIGKTVSLGRNSQTSNYISIKTLLCHVCHNCLLRPTGYKRKNAQIESRLVLLFSNKLRLRS